MVISNLIKNISYALSKILIKQNVNQNTKSSNLQKIGTYQTCCIKIQIQNKQKKYNTAKKVEGDFVSGL